MKSVWLLFLLLPGCWAPQAFGQHYLAVRDGEKDSVVVDAQGVLPMVLRGDELTAVHASSLALGKGGEYLPMFVSIRNAEVTTSSMAIGSSRANMNREFRFVCNLETAYSLNHVFIVILLRNRAGESGIFLFGVGRLEPREPTPFRATVPMNMDNEEGRYEVYLFSAGRELFHSMMPVGVADSALNRMVRQRIKDVKDSPVKPFVGPAPEFPKALRRKKIDGTATVSFTVDPRGRVGDPAVVSASQPEFGEAALAAIRQWRFLPGVKDGRPVESRAEMPFEFTSPKND